MINALTKQKIALVSDIAGTTTDPVYKAMELLPLGPIMLIDTAGIDDVGDLGKLRIGKTREVMTKTDVALIVMDAANPFSEFEEKLIEEFKRLGTPYLLVLNKCDTVPSADEIAEKLQAEVKEEFIVVSALNKSGFDRLRSAILSAAPRAFEDRPLIRDLLNPAIPLCFACRSTQRRPRADLFCLRFRRLETLWMPTRTRLSQKKTLLPLSWII